MGMNRLKIGVVGLTPGAGAGFIAVNLAAAFSKEEFWRPALLELAGNRLYDGLAMDKHFATRDYYDFHGALLQNQNFRGICNELDGVNWVLNLPRDTSKTLDLMRMIRLINNVAGNVVISKISDLEEDDLWEVLQDMDQVLVVIDPLPSMLLSGYKFFCSLRTSKLSVTYVVNKMNGGVSRRDLLGYLRLKRIHYVPLVEPSLIYGAEYSCKFYMDIERIRMVIEDPIRKILDQVIRAAEGIA